MPIIFHNYSQPFPGVESEEEESFSRSDCLAFPALTLVVILLSDLDELGLHQTSRGPHTVPLGWSNSRPHRCHDGPRRTTHYSRAIVVGCMHIVACWSEVSLVFPRVPPIGILGGTSLKTVGYIYITHGDNNSNSITNTRPLGYSYPRFVPGRLCVAQRFTKLLLSS